VLIGRIYHARPAPRFAILPAMLLSSAVLAAAVLAAGPVAPRGNTVLQKDLDQRVFTVAASVRMGILIGGGDVVIKPPLGYGFGLKLAYYPLRLGPMRFGFAFHGGHTRYMGARNVTNGQDGPITRRWSVLSHTDIALGPHFQVPAGPLLIELGAGGGLGISSYRRVVDAEPGHDDSTVAYNGLVRADLTLGVPIRNNQGIALGVDLQKYFSQTRVVTVPDAPMGAEPDSVVFDLTLAVTLAYQMWF
jgi:hypothetical protein